MATTVIFKDKKTEEIVLNAALILVGVMFIFSNYLGEKLLSIIFGTALIILGLVMFIVTLINERSVLKAPAIFGLVILALGIFCIVQNIASWVFTFIPYFLIILGVGLIVDAFLGYFWREDEGMALFILKLVIGCALIVLGILILTVDAVTRIMGIIFGISVIVYGLYNIIYLLAKKKD